jgi:hypothetical protein
MNYFKCIMIVSLPRTFSKSCNADDNYVWPITNVHVENLSVAEQEKFFAEHFSAIYQVFLEVFQSLEVNARSKGTTSRDYNSLYKSSHKTRS